MEHFDTKKIGFDALEQFERVAKKRVILSAPVGYSWQRPVGGNAWQEHHIGWVSEGFIPRGSEICWVT